VISCVIVGSWARGDPRDDSDIDLVLLSRDPGVYIDSVR
jgi:predicted nucleotidyltransferase